MENRHSLPFGAFVEGDHTTFKLLAPDVQEVDVVIFSSAEDESGMGYPMEKNEEGIFTATVRGAGYGTIYGYRLPAASSQSDVMVPRVVISDPYAKATVGQNAYRHVAKSLIIRNDSDWGDDTWMKLDPRDAVICELHIRDMTAHPSSGARQPGTYVGLADPHQQGGITHILDMGYNAVELMPVMDFARFEKPPSHPPSGKDPEGNLYARNHWGYMTNSFFAPENYYATDFSNEPNAWVGVEGRAVHELKQMVKEFHSRGIAVIMDAVFNHVSEYDLHPFRHIGHETYFRLDTGGNYTNESGCKNDTRTESPPMRQLILESVRYWMTEYHIDGFRFDLANLIDAETREAIISEARTINPHAFIIAEPWGGGYNPSLFSEMGWASFNDRFRDGVKGQNPAGGKGFVFGQWQGDTNQMSLRRFVTGSLRSAGGQYEDVTHCVNYLESHDDYTLGDFIRIGSGTVGPYQVIENIRGNARIGGRQLLRNKLGALFLLTSQGIVMLHQGQSWGRSKVIFPAEVSDPQVGLLDRNSYNKDNETNWLNWDHKELNSELVDYHRGLIALRKANREFRQSSPDDFHFFDVGETVAVAYLLHNRFVVAMNGDQESPLQVKLPGGSWKVIVDGASVDSHGKGEVSNTVSVPPVTGVVLQRLVF